MCFRAPNYPKLLTAANPFTLELPKYLSNIFQLQLQSNQDEKSLFKEKEIDNHKFTNE